jgi:hypothetical protein
MTGRFTRFPRQRARSSAGRVFESIPKPEGAQALGQLPFGTMNKTEAAYNDFLTGLLRAGEVQWFKFEAVKLRLADNTFYTCDFCVLPRGGILEMHEVKGFWQDAGRIKIKVAASLYPFKFVAVTAKKVKDGGGWKREEF